MYDFPDPGGRAIIADAPDAPTARGPGGRWRLRPLHRTPSPTVRLQRALEALAKADVKARHFHATGIEASLADGLVQLRCAAAGVRLALSAQAAGPRP